MDKIAVLIKPVKRTPTAAATGATAAAAAAVANKSGLLTRFTLKFMTGCLLMPRRLMCQSASEWWRCLGGARVPECQHGLDITATPVVREVDEWREGTGTGLGKHRLVGDVGNVFDSCCLHL
ncbi:hypothetical protein E2C01_065766 [Portunus trituberculatus]|uniref:Uncharacterized protein n=1 Tax=Portunus trituberculatus TaxID=210409 RepID=A0A5B7HS22_PORTR|nr:hypothetical protein [Portunus trituberculatus]